MENFRDLPAEKEIQYRGRLLLIWNPVAGKKQSKRYLPDIISLYSELGYRVEVVATRGPGSVPHLIRRFGHEADRIVTIGGDGTFNETISGVLREGLDVPDTTRLIYELNREGFALPLEALGVADCAKEIAEAIRG